MLQHSPRQTLRTILASLLFVTLARTQCNEQWLPGLWLPNSFSPAGNILAITSWDPDGPGPASAQLVVGGDGAGAGFHVVAAWDPVTTAWTTLAVNPLGLGVGIIRSLTTLANGDLVAGGTFTHINGVPAANIATYNGTTWAPLSSGMNGAVYALTTLPGGDLIAAGGFTVAGGIAAPAFARWDGNTWAPLGSSSTVGAVFSLATLPNGNIVAGGGFTNLGGVSANYVAIYDGSSWAPLGVGVNSNVHALLVQPNGDLVVGGGFTTAGGSPSMGVARWSGGGWVSMDAGFPFPQGVTVQALTSLTNGDVVAAGVFSNGALSGHLPEYIARWNGNAWTQVGQGLGLNYRTYALLTMANGDLVAGGEFTSAGGNPSGKLARFVASCAATATSYGTSCPSSGGANVLDVVTQPWAGTTFRARGTGLPTLALVAAITGFSATSIPLATVLPQGQLGCDLLVAPDLIDLLIVNAGTAQSQVVLPNSPTLAGQSFFHQMVPIELDLNGNLSVITATNALQLTIATL